MADLIPDLQNATVFIVALSIASERLTEIVKGMFFPSLVTEITEDEKKEAKRCAKIQILAMCSGIIVTAVSYKITKPFFAEFTTENIPEYFVIISVGLLASGGSGAWNSILAYLLRLKKVPIKPD